MQHAHTHIYFLYVTMHIHLMLANKYVFFYPASYSRTPGGRFSRSQDPTNPASATGQARPHTEESEQFVLIFCNAIT